MSDDAVEFLPVMPCGPSSMPAQSATPGALQLALSPFIAQVQQHRHKQSWVHHSCDRPVSITVQKVHEQEHSQRNRSPLVARRVLQGAWCLHRVHPPPKLLRCLG